MIPILQSIAQAYTERYGKKLSEICFLFPNKRSATIFKKHISEIIKEETNLPKLWTINRFISSIAKRKEATRLEQLFTLYNCYQKLERLENPSAEDVDIDFDNFRNLGEIILSDFNTVDQNLVKPEEIFKNVRDLREISSNFLTEEQKEVMREYFGRTEYEDPSNFWKILFTEKPLSETKQKFMNLWMSLEPLHESFVNELDKRGMASSGGIYRWADKNLERLGRQIFHFKKIVVVGFNVLNGAEQSIFKKLQSFPGYVDFDDFADFIWDFTGPLLNNTKLSCSKFITYNQKKFPTAEWIKKKIAGSNTEIFPQIKIISSPSYTSQLKIAGKILAELDKSPDTDNFENAETVLVLPDESLLSNTLYSLPKEVKKVNLTMGYSFKNTSIASFMNILRRNYKKYEMVKGQPTFFVKELKNLLAHPFSYLIFGTENLEKILSYLNKNHKITINSEEINSLINKGFTLFNFPSKKEEGKQMFSYLENLLDHLLQLIGSDENSTHQVPSLEREHIQIYKDNLTDLKKYVNEYDIPISPMGVLINVDKLISAEKIGFEGEPLSGLQIMGTLETRLLDFKNVILVSMNEGIMPKKSRIKSFIPETLRKAYGLPPSYYSEEIFAYYFFRLISRAEKVFLIYDSQISNGKRGGESRYLLQLKQYAPQDKLSFENWSFLLEGYESEPSEIHKTDKILEKLNPYLSGHPNKRYLSSSSLSNYRDCQIKFYLRNVLNINPDPESEEFIDSISLGKILHDVMMQIYVSEENKEKLLKNPEIIDSGKIKILLNSDTLLKTLIRKSINKIFFHRNEKDEKGKDKDYPLSQTSELVGENILSLVKQILQHDLELAPFKIWGCEITENLELELSNGRKVNFRFAIDRLDEIMDGSKNSTLRIVDYKSGALHIEAENIEEVINGDNKSEQIFQLFTYAWVLNKKDFAKDKKILTEIYKVPDILTKPQSGIPKIGKRQINGYNDPGMDFSIAFNEGIENLINDIFDSPSFKPSKNHGNCDNCPFISICMK